MKKTATYLTIVMLGINALYCALIYKCGRYDGEEGAFGYVREKIHELEL